MRGRRQDLAGNQHPIGGRIYVGEDATGAVDKPHSGAVAQAAGGDPRAGIIGAEKALNLGQRVIKLGDLRG